MEDALVMINQIPLLKTEDIAYWYFRINGCLNLVNFLVHHERRGYTGTEVDVLAVRFPYRRELALSNWPMIDHLVFKSTGKIDLIICEVKTGLCDLNGPWTDPERQNIHRVLYAFDAFTSSEVPAVADALYERQGYVDGNFRVRLLAVGQRKNLVLAEAIVQLSWDQMLAFIYERFVKYQDVKAEHDKRDRTGKRIFDMAIDSRNQKEFIEAVMAELGLGVSCSENVNHQSGQQRLFDFDDEEKQL